MAEGTIKEQSADTAKGTPMECPPPKTRETVGVRIPAISSESAKPASTSPPMVFRMIRSPSMASLFSAAISRGISCSYLVLFCPSPS